MLYVNVISRTDINQVVNEERIDIMNDLHETREVAIELLKLYVEQIKDYVCTITCEYGCEGSFIGTIFNKLHENFVPPLGYHVSSVDIICKDKYVVEISLSVVCDTLDIEYKVDACRTKKEVVELFENFIKEIEEEGNIIDELVDDLNTMRYPF